MILAFFNFDFQKVFMNKIAKSNESKWAIHYRLVLYEDVIGTWKKIRKELIITSFQFHVLKEAGASGGSFPNCPLIYLYNVYIATPPKYSPLLFGSRLLLLSLPFCHCLDFKALNTPLHLPLQNDNFSLFHFLCFIVIMSICRIKFNHFFSLSVSLSHQAHHSINNHSAALNPTNFLPVREPSGETHCSIMCIKATNAKLFWSEDHFR